MLGKLLLSFWVLFIIVFLFTNGAFADCSITTTLKLGSKGSQVSCLQTSLGLTADGSFGSQTKSAVMDFQKTNGLTADGIVGSQTIAKLNLNTVSKIITLQGPAGPQGPPGPTGPKGDSGNSGGGSMSPAYVGVIQPNPASNFSGATLFSATNLSSNSFSTKDANITTLSAGALTVTGNSALTGSLTIAGALTSGTFNGLTITNNGNNTLNIAAGKTLTISNTLTLTGTDNSTLNIGTGGTLGTAAYTATTAYEVPLTFDSGLTRTVNAVTNNLITGLTGGQIIIGGTTAGDYLTYKSTTGAGTAASIAHQFVGGTNGGTTALTILNNGNVGIGTTVPGEKLEVVGNIISKGTSWTSRVSPDEDWQDITYGNGLFVAVGETSTGSRVMTSPDGINWTSRTSAADNSWKGITYGNGLFVAVSKDGTNNRVMTSPDGINWTSRAPAAEKSWRNVAYGNGLFVSISDGTSGGDVMTSPDGINWTLRSSGMENGWLRITYGNGLFVAVRGYGTLGSAYVMTSPDGISWTSGTGGADIAWKDVTYGNGLFVAVAFDMLGGGVPAIGNRIMTSPDGATWTSRTNPADNNWSTITYGNGLFVAVADNGTSDGIMTSPDGINWTLRTSAANNAWKGIAYGNGIFVAVAETGTGNRVMTSGKMELDVLATNNIYQGGMNIFGNVGIGNTNPGTKLVVGTATTGTGNITVYGTVGTCVLGDSISGASCSSDLKLKDNVTNLGSELNNIMALRPVTFTWKDTTKNQETNTGFIAQEVQSIYPTVVHKVYDDILGIDYASLIVPTIKAIQEMNLKITELNNVDKENTWRDSLVAWFANATNGIAKIFAGEVHTNKLCVGDVCVSQEQFLAMTQNSGNSGTPAATCSDGIKNQDETGIDTGGVCAPAVTLQSLTVTTPATKLSYVVGDTLDITGLEITGTYSDASTKVETISATDVSGFDSSAPVAGQTLTITVGGKTATYTIDVIEAAQ